MTFNSIAFAVFLAVVLPLYWLVPRGRRNVVLLVASYVFYGWWDWRFLGLIAASTVVDYSLARSIAGSENETARRRLLGVSLGFNLGVLGVFKYAGFFVESAQDFLGMFGLDSSSRTLGILLPVGISFYTFQTISYSFDVYRRQVTPTRGFVDFATYVAYFPQLVAGPIERARRLLPRIEAQQERSIPRGRQLDRALSLILSGFFKKIVLADGVANVVNEVFDDPDRFSAIAIGAAIVGFAIQLYGDFSGYTDIARGVSELFGIDLMVNFRQPYLSRNITEFWRRWHISLSDWLRDYVYIPFGGNRSGGFRTARNLMATMLLGGLWHGASWNFVVWGALHGTVLAVHRFAAGGTVPAVALRWRDAPAVVVTFSIWCTSMVFFRAETLPQALDLFRGLARLTDGEHALGSVALVALLGCIMFVLDIAQRRLAEPADGAVPTSHESDDRRPKALAGLTAGLMLVAVVVYSGGTPVPFIYFQF